MRKQWFAALLISVCSSVLSIACAESDAKSSNAELRDTARVRVSTARAASAAFDAQRAFAILKKQCEFGPRPPGSAAHNKTRDYLLAELQKYADSVAFQPHQYETGKVTLHLNNILAEFGTSTSGETLLLAAHWDTRPFR